MILNLLLNFGSIMQTVPLKHIANSIAQATIGRQCLLQKIVWKWPRAWKIAGDQKWKLVTLWNQPKLQSQKKKLIQMW